MSQEPWRAFLKIHAGEGLIVVDQEDNVLYPDFLPLEVPADRVVHLTDLFEKENRDAHRVFEISRNRPLQGVETEINFQGESRHIRVFTEDSLKPVHTHIFIGPSNTNTAGQKR